jgi:hypothetical protein
MLNKKIMVLAGIMISSVLYVGTEPEVAVAVKKKKKNSAVSAQQFCQAVADVVQQLPEVCMHSGRAQAGSMSCLRTMFEGNTASFDALTKDQKEQALALQMKYKEECEKFIAASNMYYEGMKSFKQC